MKSKAILWRFCLLATLVSSISLLNLCPRTAFACSCIPPESPQEEFKRSTAVFAGKVVAIDAPIGTVISSADPVQITFDVVEVWKGPAYRRLVVTTARDGASCGYSFQRGETYLVYAFDQGDGLTTNLCTRNNILAQAPDDRAALGTGAVPTVDGPLSPQPFGIPLLPLLSVIILALLAVTFIIRKRRSPAAFLGSSDTLDH